jgi:hypothetical protein
MPERRRPLRRGEVIGQRVDKPVTDEAEHFIRCPDCGGWIDMRDLCQVFEHAGPLPIRCRIKSSRGSRALLAKGTLQFGDRKVPVHAWRAWGHSTQA